MACELWIEALVCTLPRALTFHISYMDDVLIFPEHSHVTPSYKWFRIVGRREGKARFNLFWAELPLLDYSLCVCVWFLSVCLFCFVLKLVYLDITECSNITKMIPTV